MMTPFKTILMKRHDARVLEDSGYNIKTFPETTDEEVWDIFRFLYHAHVMCEPYPGARSYLEMIYRLSGRPPIILTSRPFKYATQTHEQVKALIGDLPYHLIISGTPAEKKYLYADHFDIMVDDRIETLSHLAAHYQKDCILIKKPWNRNVDYCNVTDRIIEVSGVKDITPFLRLLIRPFNKRFKL
jgi:hypothetical protein